MTGEYFYEALKLLIELHELTASGKSDSQEADAVRDKLDVYWCWCAPEHAKPLSDKECEIIDSVSAALNGTYKEM